MKKLLLGSGALVIGFLSGSILASGNKSEKIKYESIEIQPMKIIISNGNNNVQATQKDGSCGG